MLDAAVPAEPKVTRISYCPCLGIYHYKRSDGDEFFFDSEKLEQSLMVYVQQGDQRQGEFMAMLTGLARQIPHKIIEIDAEGRLTIKEPVVYRFDDGESSFDPSSDPQGG
jgi:hypothetical protein